MAGALGGVLLAGSALGNGGPFVIKYPGGDPAAKGVLARLDPDLKPARETRLQVIKEDLAIRFEPEGFRLLGPSGDYARGGPVVAVTASYLITNRTTETVEVDFGFPIVRGIYVEPWSMMPRPDVQVSTDGTRVQPALISNSAIYGILRRKAVQAIKRGIQADAKLQRAVEAVQLSNGAGSVAARRTLLEYLTGTLQWPAREAALLVEYAALQPDARPVQRAAQAGAKAGAFVEVPQGLWWGRSDATLAEAIQESAWATTMIGEQKTTQWLTLLAARLEPASAGSYDAIFAAWGGDVRERSVDPNTGRIRPREISSEALRAVTGNPNPPRDAWDPTVYARVDYLANLESRKDLTPEQKVSWKVVVKELPVVFSFAPMNLLHYRVSFAPGAVRIVAVSYRQHAYLDTAAPPSYQVAYVVHPASLWDSFGPIELTVTAPAGVTPASSMPLRQLSAAAKPALDVLPGGRGLSFDSYAATVSEKTGELFIGIKADDWKKALSARETAAR